MRLIPQSLKWRTICCGFVLGVLAVYLIATGETGSRVLYRLAAGTTAEPLFLKQHLRHSDYPVEQALARNCVRAGDSFDEFIASYPPDEVIEHGGYRTAQFGTPRSARYRACGPQICGNYWGCEVRARGGQLVSAVAYSHYHALTAFNRLSADESAAADASYEVEVMRPLRRWTASHAAVLGVAALTRYTRIPDAFPPVE